MHWYVMHVEMHTEAQSITPTKLTRQQLNLRVVNSVLHNA